MDDSFQELVSLIKEKAVNRRALVISADDINLESERKNTIYLLELGESNAEVEEQEALVREMWLGLHASTQKTMSGSN